MIHDTGDPISQKPSGSGGRLTGAMVLETSRGRVNLGHVLGSNYRSKTPGAWAATLRTGPAVRHSPINLLQNEIS